MAAGIPKMSRQQGQRKGSAVFAEVTGRRWSDNAKDLSRLTTLVSPPLSRRRTYSKYAVGSKATPARIVSTIIIPVSNQGIYLSAQLSPVRKTESPRQRGVGVFKGHKGNI